MIARISPRRLRGTVAAIPSKSEAHRSLICAALSDAPTRIVMGEGSEDISATIRCLTAFGAKIERTDFGLRVEPIAEPPVACDADCGESGSTLRFLLPVAAALGVDARFHMRGRLPDRPIAPLDRELTRGGCEITRPERDVLRIRGKLRPGEYELPGDVSSQYISGLLFALPLLDGESRLTVTGKRESVDYVAMTLQSLSRFGVEPEQSGADYIIGRNHSDRSLENTGVGGRLDAQTPFSGEAFNGGGDSNSRDRSRAATCIGENGVNSCDRSLREMCGNGSGSNSCDRSLGESCPDNGVNSLNRSLGETCGGDRSNSRSCSLGETCGGDGSSSCDRTLRESCPDNGVNSLNRSLGETCGGNRPNSCDRSLRESCPDNGVNSLNRSLGETCGGDRSNSRSCSLGETCGGDGSSSCDRTLRESCPDNGVNSRNRSLGETCGGNRSNSCDRSLRETCPDNGGNSRNCPLRETCGDGNRSNSCDHSLGETCGDGANSSDRPPAETHGGGSNSPYRSPGKMRVGGDWSNAAFWLCADALPGCAVNVTGLDESSAQGDRRVAEELRRMRAGETLLDAADIPDLVPILAATACARGQALRVIRAGRLRIKESDRLASVSRTLRALGGDVTETEDGLIVAGNSPASEAPSPIDPRIHTDPIHTCDADAYWPGFAEEGAADKPALHEKALSAIDPHACDAGDRQPDFAEDSATDRPELRKIPFSAIDPRTRDAACRPSFAEDSATAAPELRKKPSSAIDPRTRDADACRPSSADDSAAGLGETEANSIQQGSPKPRRTVDDASACAVHCEAVDAPGFDEAETNSIRQVAHEARQMPVCALTGGVVDSCGDHRIAMMAAVASCACANEVVVRGAEAVNKSYPGFWRDFVALGGCVELTEN